MDFLLTPRALPDVEVEVPEAGNRCKLMSNFAIVVQLLLATIAFSTLIFKRSKERPMRPLKIWYAERLSTNKPSVCRSSAKAVAFKPLANVFTLFVGCLMSANRS